MFQEGPIEGLVLRPIERLEDARGWLVELFRQDELDEAVWPVMAYLSQTLPGMARGPHEHRHQSDLFVFAGPGDFKLYAWDARRGRSTFGRRRTFVVGQSNPQAVMVPCGVVHAYKNISDVVGLVVNCPNRLYAGPGRQEPVDEIRHEDHAESPYVLD